MTRAHFRPTKYGKRIFYKLWRPCHNPGIKVRRTTASKRAYRRAPPPRTWPVQNVCILYFVAKLNIYGYSSWLDLKERVINNKAYGKFLQKNDLQSLLNAKWEGHKSKEK